MRIPRDDEHVPGGIMTVPLLLGAFLLCMGAQIPIRATGVTFEEGTAILPGKPAR